MIKLALPSMVMLTGEFFAFQVITLAASYISLTHLATMPILGEQVTLLWMTAFSISVATSNRVGNLIGANRPDAAKTSAAVGLWAGVFVGACNAFIAYTLQRQIARLFTDDEEIIELAARTAIVLAWLMFFDAVSAVTNGMLRGLGLQIFGGILCLVTYYVVAMPISFGAAFGLHLELNGLWSGPAIAQMM